MKAADASSVSKLSYGVAAHINGLKALETCNQQNKAQGNGHSL